MKRLLPCAWLAVAALFTYLANLDTPISMAAWLAPVFLLRFVRQTRPAAGFAAGLVVVQTAALFLAFREMWPLPPIPFQNKLGPQKRQLQPESPSAPSAVCIKDQPLPRGRLRRPPTGSCP